MRERAETEVPPSDSSQQEDSSLATKVDETKEAVEKVAEKLEELSEKVHDHETSQGKK